MSHFFCERKKFSLILSKNAVAKEGNCHNLLSQLEWKRTRNFFHQVEYETKEFRRKINIVNFHAIVTSTIKTQRKCHTREISIAHRREFYRVNMRRGKINNKKISLMRIIWNKIMAREKTFSTLKVLFLH